MKSDGSVIEINDTKDALARLEIWFAAYKRWRWIRGIYNDFVDAYDMPWSPVSAGDAPEIERLEKKLSTWDDKAHRKYEDAEDVVIELKKHFRDDKAFKARYLEISRYIAKIELCLPDDWVFPDNPDW